MQQALPELPMELLLDILETLLALGGKVNQRSAAYLAQSCRSLRTSKAGKQARYIHALARHSMSVPERLPRHIEYETEVLEQASWPPSPPQLQQRRSAHEPELQDVWEATLETDGHVTLSIDRKSLHCFATHATQPAASSSFSASRESSVLQRTIAFPSPVSAWAVDQDRHRCAVAYDAIETEGDLKQILEVWSLVTGARQASFDMLNSGGLAFEGEVDHIELNAQYLMIGSCPNAQYQVYSIPQDYSSDVAWPIVWSTDSVNRHRNVQIVSLLSPRFVAVITEFSGNLDEDSPGSCVCIEVYRLGHASSRLVAIFDTPEQSLPGSDTELSLTAGAELALEEVGVVVVTTVHRAYLIPIATLVNILYSNAEDVDGQARSFDTDWLDTHASCVTFPQYHAGRCRSVSGWKCVFGLRAWRQSTVTEIRKLWFVDAFSRCSQPRAGDAHPSHDSVISTESTQAIGRFFPLRAQDMEHIHFAAQLRGGRLLLCLQRYPSKLDPSWGTQLLIFRL